MTISAAKLTEITEENISTLVATFYGRVRADPALGPVFERAIAGDWEPHLRKMDAFWSSVMLTSGAYKGNPVAKHQAVDGIRPEMFARWLELFDITCREMFTDDISDQFQAKAITIAASLKFMIFEWKPATASAAAP